MLNNIISLLVAVITFCLALGNPAEVNFKKRPLKLEGCCLIHETKRLENEDGRLEDETWSKQSERKRCENHEIPQWQQNWVIIIYQTALHVTLTANKSNVRYQTPNRSPYHSYLGCLFLTGLFFNQSCSCEFSLVEQSSATLSLLRGLRELWTQVLSITHKCT